jgi:hypothetical protein
VPEDGRFLSAARSSALPLLRRGSPKYERAALRWLERYLVEREPSLVQFARLAGGLAKRVE